MKIEETQTKNGAKIIAAHIPDAQTVAIHFGFRTGSRSEPLDIWGISHFLEHMMFKGSKKRPNTAKIAKEIDKLGAEYNAFTGKELTDYYIKTAAENFDLSLDVIGDMVTNPILSDVEIKKESGTIIQEARMYNDNPSMNIFFLMEQTLYGSKSALGKDEIGTTKTITGANHKKMKQYFQKYYGSGNSVIVVAGKLPKNYLAKITRYQKNLPVVKRNQWEQATFSQKKLDVIYKKTDQAHFGLTLPGLKLDDPDKYVLEVIATILGGYMSSRLFTEIREKRGWAYRVNAFSDEFSDTGYLAAFGGVKKDKVFESIQIVKDQILNLAKTVTDEEVIRAKSHLVGSNALRFEDPNELARQLLFSDVIMNKIETPAKIEKEIKKVTKKDIVRVCRNLFKKDSFYLTVIGPFKNKEKFAKILA